MFAEYRKLGIRTIPLEGKKPLVRWSDVTLADCFEQTHPTANVGAICGDVVTIVDVDDPRFIDEARRIFGDTPLESRTRKGQHLWYRANGERRRHRVFGSEFPIDILGIGGYAVVPNSQGYEFTKGSLADIVSLPAMNAGSVPAQAEEEQPTFVRNQGYKGTRNQTLFDEGRRYALTADHQLALLSRLESLNATFQPPLSRKEVQSVAKSLWRYKEEDRLLVSGRPSILITRDDHDLLRYEPDAYVLLMDLRNNHRLRIGEFALANAGA